MLTRQDSPVKMVPLRLLADVACVLALARLRVRLYTKVTF